MARAAAATASAPWPVTRMVRSGSSARAVASAWARSGAPASGCRTLGRSEFIRVPWPAASTMTATGMRDLWQLGRRRDF